VPDENNTTTSLEISDKIDHSIDKQIEDSRTTDVEESVEKVIERNKSRWGRVPGPSDDSEEP
jgi:hypothetical protein